MGLLKSEKPKIESINENDQSIREWIQMEKDVILVAEDELEIMNQIKSEIEQINATDFTEFFVNG